MINILASLYIHCCGEKNHPIIGLKNFKTIKYLTLAKKSESKRSGST